MADVGRQLGVRVGQRMKRLPDVEREGGCEDESLPDVYSAACRAPAFHDLLLGSFLSPRRNVGLLCPIPSVISHSWLSYLDIMMPSPPQPPSPSLST